MGLRTGAPAEGSDFFDRVIERAQFWRVLDGNHVVLAAPRRLGKTSLLKQLAVEAADHGLLAVYLDVSPLADAAALAVAIDQALPDSSVQAHLKRAGNAVSGWFSRIGRVRVDAGELGGLELETRPGAAPEGWPERLARLRRRLAGQPVLIVLDEYSVFLQRLLQRDHAQAVALLSTLRSWRQQSGLACRFVMSGSVSLHRLLEAHGLHNETNDCHAFDLQPFAPQDALAMLHHFSHREGWPLGEGEAAHLCQRVGWLSPFYLALLLEESIQAAMLRHRCIGPTGLALQREDIEAGHARLIDTRSRFVNWYLRLAELLTEADLAYARAVLVRLAQRTEGLLETTALVDRSTAQGRQAPSATQQRQRGEILLLLEEHGYLVRDGQRLKFQSPLLRLYWHKHHGR